MKHLGVTALYVLSIYLVVASAKARTASSNSLQTLERKPFASPEKPAILQSYKRIKREATKTMQEFQDYIRQSKISCGTEMGFTKEELEKSFLYNDNMTSKEKCLVACVFKRMKLMDKSHKLSPRSIGRIAEIISSGNALVVAIALATADNCNKNVNAAEPCEAAHQINKCISNELRAHKVKLSY